METRKEFLEAVMKMADLKDLKQADDAARAVISLTKAIIGEELSQKVAESLRPIFVLDGNPSRPHRWMIMNVMSVYLKPERSRKRIHREYNAASNLIRVCP